MLLLAPLVLAAPVEYSIAPAQGDILGLEVFKTGFMRGKKHSFTFDRYHGTALFDGERPEASRVELAIDSASITLHDTWLSSKDFKKVEQYARRDMLATERYPEIKFSSESVRSTAKDQYDVQGKLTIRDITKPVRIEVKRKGEAAFEGAARINMTDYGLKPPSAALGTVGTKDEMAFTFALTLTDR